MAPIDISDIPGGKSADVVEWVNEDPDELEDRARAALEAEQVKGARARKGLIGQLLEILGEDPPDDDEVVAVPPGETVWFETSTGQWHVEVGSAAYERLLEDGARVIDAPDDAD